MPYNRLSTSKIAKIVGCHPNTVRMYEAWGLLPPVPRAANGYRLYTLDHLDQMRLARTALNTAWPGKTIRKAAFELIHQAARGDLGGALESAYRYLVLVQSERNGLLDVPKDPHNQYRLYDAPELARARVIRVLRNVGYSLMAIYRMLDQLDADSSTDIKHALDTPHPEEDVSFATDHWLSTLQDIEHTAREMIRILEEWIKRKGGEK
ncbi:MAG: MerR family transcriptional regulator [Anaerolineaceae bacterium]|nr:MerR family transcriptional regulator [Anaerolineaceae bacterium]